MKLAQYRRSQIAFGVVGAGGLLLLAVFAHAWMAFYHPHGSILTRGLGLTDLTLFTEARYTRHPSQADLHTPFQDHPSSFDHFPSGSIVGPKIPQKICCLDMGDMDMGESK